MLRAGFVAAIAVVGVGGTGAAAGAGGRAGGGAGGATGGSGGGGTAGGAGPGGSAGGTMTCSRSVSVGAQAVDVLIVQDKSLSMEQDPTGNNCNTVGCSKWSLVSAAVDSVVMATQTTVNWGLVFFGNNSTCGVSTTPNVPITAGMSYTPISQAYANSQPASQTPTALAVNAAVTYLQTVTDGKPKYLLLATDGLPNCATGDSNTSADDSPAAVASVASAKAAGFPTFVVGIATSSDAMATSTLNMMALAGAEPQIGSADGNSFYEVNSTVDLERALDTIVGLVGSCTIPLTGVDGTLDKVAVSAKDAGGNEVQIAQDPTNGWSYTDGSMTAIVLNGAACTSLQTGAYTDLQFITSSC